MAETTAEKRSYKDTLNLPKTAFPMKANLVQNEPASLKRWQQEDLYGQLRAARKDAPKYVFHDGPPYANGSIHLGHLLNKVLKDIIVRYKSMAGFDVPYIPGWDCHGLPIEHKVVQEIGASGGKAREMEPLAIRRKCKAYAEKFVKLQSQQMQRLLTLADYANPYLTMAPSYEAGTLEVFADLVERGIVYRGLKPVHWSIENQTALADAELEYYDREDMSIYVAFRVDPVSWREQNLPLPTRATVSSDVRLVIWTTTPWTLPANLAVAISPRAEYGLYNVMWHGELVSLIIADELALKVLKLGDLEKPLPDEPIARFTGEQLLGLRYDHPFIDDGSNRRVVGADYVTLEDGTGLVHTAPGHGTEDYQTGLREGLAVYCPVRGDGTFDDSVPEWLRGVSVWDANKLVIDRLRESEHLFHAHAFTHSYPHDWRGKTPIIFRATEQWFINVDQDFDLAGDAQRPLSLRARALTETAEDVAFIPEWGRNRMRGMLESRPDWCVSRQRSWGLPIPAFYGENEGEVLLTPASIRAVGKVVREKGSDVWFLASPEDLLAQYDVKADKDAPAWVADALSRKRLRKSTDIFDVWFDSGTSWNSCVRTRFGEGSFPTDLYLEGSDQHRGWFQASLLPALGATGKPPFRALLTHGFMVDKDGKKMSKSLGNTLEVEELMKNYGADVCRWWVSSLSYENDIKVDESFFQLAGESYRKVRNTIRFLLSNLYDFDPTPGKAYDFSAEDASSIDAWALGELDTLIAGCVTHYDAFQFRKVHELLFNFCNDTLSAVYLAAVKDRLYCDAADAPRRRRTQTAMYRITDALVRLLAPLLPHTTDEAWAALHSRDGARQPAPLPSVHLAPMPGTVGAPRLSQWPQVMQARERAIKSIETARVAQGIENPLEMGLRVRYNAEREPWLAHVSSLDFADLCGVSRAELVPDASHGGASPIEVLDLRSEPRCERSWKRDGTVKQRSDGGMLTDRDAKAVGVA